MSVPAIVFAGALAALTVIAAPASAFPHPFLETLGSAAQPSFGEARGIAVDQSSGDILVMDAGSSTVSRYNPDGTPANFTALGTNVIDGKGSGDETPQGGLGFSSASEAQIAVDNSGTVTDGNIYVTQSFPNVINIFAESGEYLGQLAAAGATEFTEACGVAVDPSGAVYVGDYGSGIHKFAPSANPPVDSDNTANFNSVASPCTLAAGAGPTAGFLFAAQYLGPISKIDSATGELKYTVSEGSNTTLTVDPVSGHVYAAKGAEVQEYDASDTSSAAPVSPAISLATAVRGVAVDSDSGNVYISRAGASAIDVYGPPVPSRPSVTREFAASASFTEAIVKASVNPNGIATTYHVEYGTDTSYGQSTAEKLIGSDEADHTVGAVLEGLMSSTTYHWRVVATNSVGTANGADRTFTTFVRTPQQTNCPNQAFRAGPSVALPDCRAYEMVSPVDKNGGDVVGICNISCFRSEINQASNTGEKFTYSSYRGFGDAAMSAYTNQYMATRGPDGWTTHGISPPYASGLWGENAPFQYLIDPEFKAFSADLSSSWLVDTSRIPLTPDAQEGFVNIYKRDSDGSLSTLTTAYPEFGEFRHYFLELEGHTPDGSHVIFTAGAALTPNAAPINLRQVYDFTGGELHLVSVLPNGTAGTGGYGALAGMVNPTSDGSGHGGDTLNHAISDDGSRIFWSLRGFDGGPDKIYVRLNPDQPQSALNGSEECTEPANACTLVVSNENAQYWTASTDGSKALFTKVEDGVKGDLYKFDVDANAATLIAHKALGVAGASDDLSRVYFVSEESLAPGAPAGQRNLYLDSEGTMTYIATLSSTDTSFGFGSSAIDPRPVNHAVRVTADGRRVAFMSTNSLTGYDNTDLNNGKEASEVYIYDSSTQRLSCVSCNPSGVRPDGAELKGPYTIKGSGGYLTGRWGAAWLNTSENSLYTPHALSEDGNRLFFNSFDALIPRDTNGAQDVYQWEAPGSGDCTTGSGSYAPANDGCVSLISTGESPEGSEFVDATPDGSDVFFRTSSSIDPRDPGLIDIYDARAGGGHPLPPTPPAPCLGDACQTIPAGPNDQTPASAAFKGAGNPTPRKPRHNCRTRNRHRAKGNHKSKRKQAKRCTRANRRAGR